MGDLPWGSHRLAGALVAQLWGLSLSPWRCMMATTIPSAALVPVTPVFSNTERLELAGFLVGYICLTLRCYELDFRQYAAWCSQHQLRRIPAAVGEALSRRAEQRDTGEASQQVAGGGGGGWGRPA